jgi:hypothetical protein
MRKCILGLSLAVSTMTMAHAQSSVPCDGVLARIRISEIKPGMFPEFEKAVAAQLAWYRGIGIKTNNIVLVKMYKADSMSYSDTEAMTIHYNSPQAGAQKLVQDDGYRAFVKMFSDSSTIKQTYDVCMPKLAIP